MNDETRNLSSYLPSIYDRVTEMQAIMSVEQPYLDDIDAQIHKAYLNTFIMTSDEDGISVYEEMLNIVPGTFDTLQTRRLRVLTMWSHVVPHTYRAFVQKLDQICGENEYLVEKDFNLYKLKIGLYDVEYAIVQAIRQMCTYVIPVNMIWWIKQTIREVLYYPEHLTNIKLNLLMPIEDFIDEVYFILNIRTKIKNPNSINSFIHRLDGTWNLDGSVTLGAMSYQLKMLTKIILTNTESITATINGEPV